MGIADHDHELPDLSADGFAEGAGLDSETLAALDAPSAPACASRSPDCAIQEWLAIAAECYHAGDTTSGLNVTESWLQYVRQIFDLMATDGEPTAADIARRMAAVSEPNCRPRNQNPGVKHLSGSHT